MNGNRREEGKGRDERIKRRGGKETRKEGDLIGLGHSKWGHHNQLAKLKIKLKKISMSFVSFCCFVFCFCFCFCLKFKPLDQTNHKVYNQVQDNQHHNQDKERIVHLYTKVDQNPTKRKQQPVNAFFNGKTI